MTEELRRVDDERYNKLDRKIDKVATDVTTIREMLISEPEASPMGRALLRIAEANRRRIDDNKQDFEEFVEKRFDPLYDWWNQTKGSWRAIQGAALVLAMIGAFFGILAYFGVRPGP